MKDYPEQFNAPENVVFQKVVRFVNSLHNEIEELFIKDEQEKKEREEKERIELVFKNEDFILEKMKAFNVF